MLGCCLMAQAKTIAMWFLLACAFIGASLLLAFKFAPKDLPPPNIDDMTIEAPTLWRNGPIALATYDDKAKIIHITEQGRAQGVSCEGAKAVEAAKPEPSKTETELENRAWCYEVFRERKPNAKALMWCRERQLIEKQLSGADWP